MSSTSDIVLVSAERYTVHLRAICPEGAGRSPGATRRKGFKGDGYLNTRARQVLRFVLPRPSWPRRRSAPPARMPTVVAAVLLSSELGPFTRCAAIATVLHRPILELRPSWRAEPLRLEGQRRVLALSKSCSREARGIEGRASAERRVHLQAASQRRAESAPCSCSSRRSNAMASLNIAPDRCNS
jgi:hypothetical protein